MGATLTILNVAIFGASGYTGIELIRILLNHPNVKIKSILGSSTVGQKITDIYPYLIDKDLPIISSLEDANLEDIDVAFFCLPHTQSQKIIKSIPKNIIVIDLSADFRLNNINDYETWYNTKHLAPTLQPQAIYGLSEVKRESIKTARIIACPGCYPTSILLPIIPLLQDNLIQSDNIISDSKSGTSGMGKKEAINASFSEINESIKAYSIGNHRHTIEIEQEMQYYSDSQSCVIHFTPHLVPMTRGILSTIYINATNDQISKEDLIASLITYYKDEYFVSISQSSASPTTKHVVNTNNCIIHVNESRIESHFTIISVIDNLTKGSSGQAVQNMNIRFQLPENTALNILPVVP